MGIKIMSTILLLNDTEIKQDAYCIKDSMKYFCDYLKSTHKRSLILERKKKNLLKIEQQEPYENAKFCYICKKEFEDKCAKYKRYYKVRDHCYYTGEYRGTAHSICNLKYSIPEEITIIFYNRPNYDHNFIISKIAEDFEGPCNFLGENNEKYIPFQFQQEKNSIELVKLSN